MHFPLLPTDFPLVIEPIMKIEKLQESNGNGYVSEKNNENLNQSLTRQEKNNEFL